MALPGGAAVQSSDWAPLEAIVQKIVKEKQQFQRLVRPLDVSLVVRVRDIDTLCRR